MMMLDIYLFKGNLLVFDDFVERFLRELHGYCTHAPDISSPRKGTMVPPLVPSNYNISVI